MASLGNKTLESAGDGHRPHEADNHPPVFVAQLPVHWALRPVHLLLTIWFSALFLLVNQFPLRSTDLWCHVLYGHWILEHRALPEHDPFCSLASEPVVDTAWLSQVVMDAVEKAGGTEWLSHLFALTVLATHLVLARIVYLQSRSPVVTLLGSLAVFVVGFSRLSTFRPETFGILCFAVLLHRIVSIEQTGIVADPATTPRKRLPWRLCLEVFVILVAWANLHGSFLCGLAVLGCWCLGAAVDTVLHRGSDRIAPMDRRFGLRLAALFFGTAATLLNPYGSDLLRQAVTFSENANLRDLLEWRPLTILGVGGREFAASWAVLLLVWRYSRLRTPVWQRLALAIFAISAVYGVRMLGWYAAIFGVVLAPHLADVGSRWATARTRTKVPEEDMTADAAVLPRGRSWRLSLASLLVVWIALATSPLGGSLLGRPGRTLPRLVGPATPVALTNYLRDHPPTGLTFNPQWWGDWLVRQGPPQLRPFVTTNVHLIPASVWRDYVGVSSGAPWWESVLDRYGVGAIVVDKAGQPLFAGKVRHSTRWQIAYEDRSALVAVPRVRQSPGQPRESSVR